MSRIRLSEARALLKAGFPSGAYYLAGYSLECALKACIAKRTKRYDFPDRKMVHRSYTHNLQELMNTAGFEEEFRADAQYIHALGVNWNIVQLWSEESRYREYELEMAEECLKRSATRRTVCFHG